MEPFSEEMKLKKEKNKAVFWQKRTIEKERKGGGGGGWRSGFGCLVSGLVLRRPLAQPCRRHSTLLLPNLYLSRCCAVLSS